MTLRRMGKGSNPRAMFSKTHSIADMIEEVALSAVGTYIFVPLEDEREQKIYQSLASRVFNAEESRKHAPILRLRVKLHRAVVKDKKGIMIERVGMDTHKIKVIYRDAEGGYLEKDTYSPFVMKIYVKHLMLFNYGADMLEDKSNLEEQRKQFEKDFWEQEPNGNADMLRLLKLRRDGLEVWDD